MTRNSSSLHHSTSLYGLTNETGSIEIAAQKRYDEKSSVKKNNDRTQIENSKTLLGSKPRKTITNTK